jgi:hypothetical protein
MRDDAVQLPKSFAPEDILVTRIIHGVPDTSLRRRDLNDVIQVTWGRETHSTVEIHINGVSVSDRNTYCDGGQLGSSVESAMEEWRDLVEEYGAGPVDRFEISVVSWVQDTPTLGYARDDVFGRKCYFRLPKEGSSLFLGVPEAGIDTMAREDIRTLDVVHHSKVKVASSLWTKEQNDQSATAFHLRISEETRTETDVFAHYG